MVRLKSAREEPYGEYRGMKPVRDKISFRRDGSTVRYSKRVEQKSYGMLQLSRRLARGFGEKDAQAWEDELNGHAVATPSFPPLQTLLKQKECSDWPVRV